MKKTLLCFLLLSSMCLSAQITLFEDGFETYPNFVIENIGSWTLTDVDGGETWGIDVGDEEDPIPVEFENSGYTGAFIVFNSLATDPLVGTAWAAHTGDKVIACFNSMPPIAPNNDWLISPRIQLGATGNSLTFWAKSAASAYPNERFKIGISTTGTAVANFTVISTGAYIQTTATWTQYTYNLDAYAGQNVYISLNCISNDQFALLIDDYKVTAATLSTSDFFATNFSVYPNPSTGLVNLASKNNTAINTIQITDLNGRVVRNINTKGVSETQINISDLTAGMYFLNVQTDSGSGTTKIIRS